MIFTIPIRIRSEGNLHEHWRKKHARDKETQAMLAIWFKNARLPEYLPCTVKFTRIAPRKIDDDNLVFSLKFCRDCVADYLIPGLARGQADSDPRIKWEYAQEKGKPKEYALKVEIVSG